jgi:hypothetical protein
MSERKSLRAEPTRITSGKRRGRHMPRAVVAKRIAYVGLATGCLLWPTVASAKLPHPKTTLIVPGTSIAGVKLDMTQNQVFHVWGRTGCTAGFCTWLGPGSAGHAERATVSFFNGKVIQIDINAATSGINLKFAPGKLSKWRTRKNISLGSTRAAVKRAYPAAKSNPSTGVNGFDLFEGAGASLRVTRFSSFGIGATPTRLRYIELACHNFRC